jgi:hypothetical protein
MAVSFRFGATSLDRPEATNSSAALWGNEETHDAASWALDAQLGGNR